MISKTYNTTYDIIEGTGVGSMESAGARGRWTDQVDNGDKQSVHPMITLDGVSKTFARHAVLEDITFDVPKGRITVILGPSGTGKSVLLKTIIGLLKPDKGFIAIDGDPIVGVSERNLYRVRRKLGVLFQDGALFGSLNLFDNIAFPLRQHTSKSEREIREIVHEKVEMVGLMRHLDKLPGEVSGGMRKRAGLARALVMNPEIILFDEPDSGLDPVRVAYLDELVLDTQSKTNATVFVITHNISSTLRIADYIGLLFRAHLVKFGSKADMVMSDDPIVQQFLEGRVEGPIGMDEMVDGDSQVSDGHSGFTGIPGMPGDAVRHEKHISRKSNGTLIPPPPGQAYVASQLDRLDSVVGKIDPPIVNSSYLWGDAQDAQDGHMMSRDRMHLVWGGNDVGGNDVGGNDVGGIGNGSSSSSTAGGDRERNMKNIWSTGGQDGEEDGHSRG